MRVGGRGREGTGSERGREGTGSERGREERRDSERGIYIERE